VPPVLFLGGLGADEHDLHPVQPGALPDGGAEGIALVVCHFHANEHRGEVAAFQPGDHTFRRAHHLEIEGRFETDPVLLQEAPVAVHEKEALAHG